MRMGYVYCKDKESVRPVWTAFLCDSYNVKYKWFMALQFGYVSYFWGNLDYTLVWVPEKTPFLKRRNNFFFFC